MAASASWQLRMFGRDCAVCFSCNKMVLSVSGHTLRCADSRSIIWYTLHGAGTITMHMWIEKRIEQYYSFRKNMVKFIKSKFLVKNLDISILMRSSNYHFSGKTWHLGMFEKYWVVHGSSINNYLFFKHAEGCGCASCHECVSWVHPGGRPVTGRATLRPCSRMSVENVVNFMWCKHGRQNKHFNR